MGPIYSSTRRYHDSRRRFTSSDIAKVWAYQQHESGRCPSSMSFEGVDFYSYSTVVASIFTHNGRMAYLLTEEHYSVTTSGHMSNVRWAIPEGAKIFYVPEAAFKGSRKDDPARILDAWKEQATRRVGELGDAPNVSYLREAEAIVQKMREFAAYFGLSLKNFAVKIPAAEKLLLQWQREAKKILARVRKTPEFKIAGSIEAYKVVCRMRTLARGAGIPIEAYRVTLPMKEPDIREAIRDWADSHVVRQRLEGSAPATGFDALTALLSAPTNTNSEAA